MSKDKKKPAKKAKKNTKPLIEQEADLTEAKPEYPQFNNMGLTHRNQDFVYFYCHPDYCYNGTRAYAKAYDLEDIDDYMTAAASASRLLKNVKVMAAVDAERARRRESHEKQANKILNRLDAMIDVDPLEALNVVGPLVTVKDVSEIPAHLRPCIKSIKTTSCGVEITFHDKMKAIELYGKAIGLFIEKTQNLNEDYESIIQKIDRERREGTQDDTTTKETPK